MIEEELQEKDLTKPFQFIHTNIKISKQQASELNLMKLVKQCQLQFQIESNFRECSQYLSELAIIYLKQHKFLKRNIEVLQNSLIDQCDNQQQNKEQKKKKKQSKIKEKSSDSRINYSDDQPQFSFKENPRNLIAADKLQLVQQQQQKTKNNIHIILKRNNQQQQEYEIDNIVKDLSQIYQYSLSDILNKKNQELKNKKQLNNREQSKQLLIYNFNDQEQEINDNLVGEVQQIDNIELEYQEIISQQQEIRRETKKQKKINTSKENKQNQQRQKQQKISKLKRTPELDLKIKEDTDEIFKNNLQTFMRHKEKINDLSLEVNFLQLEPEFWKNEDELIGLINKISFCQDSNQKKIQEENKYLIFDNMTTEIEHKKHISQNKEQHSIQNISEFEYPSQTPIKIYEQQQDNKLYQMLIQDIQNTYGKHCKLNQDNYFQVSEKYDFNKPEAFYNLLILSRVGILQIKNNSNQQGFNEIQIII